LPEIILLSDPESNLLRLSHVLVSQKKLPSPVLAEPAAFSLIKVLPYLEKEGLPLIFAVWSIATELFKGNSGE
jgi:hypothetical protein